MGNEYGPGEIRYECLWCDRSFLTYTGLMNHLLAEGEVPHAPVAEDVEEGASDA